MKIKQAPVSSDTILDLGDKSIVAFVLGYSNNNELVYKTFDIARKEYPDATPIFNSDRGFQYTSRRFHKKLIDAGMTQSMSRVSRCIDNRPMEAFWGMLKSEMYYLKNSIHMMSWKLRSLST